MSTSQLDGIARANPDLFYEQPTITLVNPYHDELGRFTSKEKAIRTLKKDMAGMSDAQKEKYLRGVVAGKGKVGGKKINLRYQEVAQKMLATKGIKAKIGKVAIAEKPREKKERAGKKDKAKEGDGVGEWIKDHKTELAVAGVAIVAVAGYIFLKRRIGGMAKFTKIAIDQIDDAAIEQAGKKSGEGFAGLVYKGKEFSGKIHDVGEAGKFKGSGVGVVKGIEESAAKIKKAFAGIKTLGGREFKPDFSKTEVYLHQTKRSWNKVWNQIGEVRPSPFKGGGVTTTGAPTGMFGWEAKGQVHLSPAFLEGRMGKLKVPQVRTHELLHSLPRVRSINLETWVHTRPADLKKWMMWEEGLTSAIADVTEIGKLRATPAYNKWTTYVWKAAQREVAKRTVPTNSLDVMKQWFIEEGDHYLELTERFGTAYLEEDTENSIFDDQLSELEKKAMEGDEVALHYFFRLARYNFPEINEAIQRVLDSGVELEIQLSNPYHDKEGRFTDKAHAVTTSGARPKDRKQELDKLETTWSKIGAAAKKVIVAPAEFLSREKGLLPKLLRGAIEIGSDIAFYKLAKAWVFANAAPLGAAATAALSMALFGAAAPTAALIFGGLAIGLGATLIASELLDWSQTKVFHAYLNRYSPKDNRHIQFSGYSTGKKVAKGVKAVYFVKGAIFEIIGGSLFILGFGDVGGIEGIIGPELAAGLEEEEEILAPTPVKAFTVAIWPHVLSVLMNDDIDEIVLPDVPALRKFPGFKKQGKELVMDWDGAHEFAEHWARGDFPDVGEIKFGDTTITKEEKEKLEESLELGNPYHDELGRFASKEGAKTTTGAGAVRGDERTRVEFKYRPGAKVDKKGFESKVNRQRKQLVKRLPGTETPPRVKMSSASVRYLGAHTATRRGGLRPYTDHTIHLPFKTMYRLTEEENGGLGHHTLLHESVHARERPKRPGIGSWQEEGSTEFITRKLYRDIYGHDSSLRAYNRYVERVGRAAWQESGGDTKKAWKYVDDVHQGQVKISSWRRMDGEGWETMLGTTYKFEEADDLMDQLLDLIEQKEWEKAKALVEAHPDNDSLVFVLGEMWIAEFGINEET